MSSARSPTFGICSNRYLDREFKTVRCARKISLNDGILEYEEDVKMQIPGSLVGLLGWGSWVG